MEKIGSVPIFQKEEIERDIRESKIETVMKKYSLKMDKEGRLTHKAERE